MRRVDCRRCLAVVVEEIPGADGKRTLTKAYMLFLVRWARQLSWKETAEMFRTSWDKVFDAVEHVVTWVSRSISRIKSRRLFGSSGRPRFRNFQRHNPRNAVRCHLRNVSGLTIINALRQLKNRARARSIRREVAVILRGLVFALLKKRALFAKEKILGHKRGSAGSQ